MAGGKDKDEGVCDGPGRTGEASVPDISECSSDEDADETVRKAQEMLAAAEKKKAEKLAAKQEKEKKRLLEEAAGALVAAGQGAGSDKKRDHMSMFVLKFPVDKGESHDNYVAWPIFENPTRNCVKDFLKAEASNEPVEVTVVEKGKSYLVLDHRDNK